MVLDVIKHALIARASDAQIASLAKKLDIDLPKQIPAPENPFAGASPYSGVIEFDVTISALGASHTVKCALPWEATGSAEAEGYAFVSASALVLHGEDKTLQWAEFPAELLPLAALDETHHLIADQAASIIKNKNNA